ncbi:hypothetical protein BJX64DRAFT_292735 [Aspergillus heterothallicus]
MLYVDRGGLSPLLRAVQVQNERAVKLLLEAGAQMSPPESEVSAPYLAGELGCPDMVRLLLDQELRPDQSDGIMDGAGDSRRESLMEYLLERGIGLNVEFTTEHINFEWAEKQGYERVIKRALEVGNAETA